VSDKSAIEWTDATWNPVRGCSHVSEGCRNCYAEGVAARFSGPGRAYEGLARFTPHGPQWTGEVRLLPVVLAQPLRWRKPRRVFVNSMSDLFHPDVPDDFIAAAFGVMSIASQHTFQILTKRPERARRWFAWMADIDAHSPGHRMWRAICETPGDWPESWEGEDGPPVADAWPLPNVWLGVSVEDQRAADERIPELLATPAAVRFLSCEPLLAPLDLESAFSVRDSHGEPSSPRCNPDGTQAIGWVIAGGESGPGARPCEPAWILSLVQQGREAGVPVFVKQMGSAWASGGKGSDPQHWPEDLRVRELPEVR
jgi:protein gp37